MTVGYEIWTERLTVVHAAVRLAARHLADEIEGPLSLAYRQVASGIWQGAVGEHFRELIRRIERTRIDPLAEHLYRMESALQCLRDEAEYAARAELANLPPRPGVDIAAGLAPWRVWPAFGPVLPPGWGQPPRSTTVSMDVDAVRGLARTLRAAGDDFASTHSRLAEGLDQVQIQPPSGLQDLARAAESLADEFLRRANAMEEADERFAREAVALAASLTSGPRALGARSGEAGRRPDPVALHRRTAADTTVPVTERYAANRWLMRHEARRLKKRRAALRRKFERQQQLWRRYPDNGTYVEIWKRELHQLEKKIARYRSWAASDRQFLVFDARGDGRVAEVFGDLEAAANLAVVVPGMGNDIANFDGRLRADANNIFQTAGPEMATIAWLGYDTPEGIDGAFGIQTERGGKALARFVGSLGGYGGKHTTVVGHSYGTTVVANAAAYCGMKVDDLVFVGSPGLGIAPNRSLGPARLWFADTPDDAVSNYLRPIHGGPADGWGAKRFRTDGASGHSEYFGRETESVKNIALIAQGSPPTLVGHP